MNGQITDVKQSRASQASRYYCHVITALTSNIIYFNDIILQVEFVSTNCLQHQLNSSFT